MALTPAQIKAIKGLLLAVSLWLWVANQGGHGQEQPREGSVGEGLPCPGHPHVLEARGGAAAPESPRPSWGPALSPCLPGWAQGGGAGWC